MEDTLDPHSSGNPSQSPPPGTERKGVEFKLENLPKPSFEGQPDWSHMPDVSKTRHNSILVTDNAQAEARAASQDIHPHFVENAVPYRNSQVWGDRPHAEDVPLPTGAPAAAAAGAATNTLPASVPTSVSRWSVGRGLSGLQMGSAAAPSESTNVPNRPRSSSGGAYSDGFASTRSVGAGAGSTVDTQQGHVDTQARPPSGIFNNGTGMQSMTSSADPRIPQNDGKIHILLGATGSLHVFNLRNIINKLESIYGSDRVSIQVILTKAASQILARHEIPANVHIWQDIDEWDTWKSRSDPVVHIELRRWADILVVAPLSANTLGKIAMGLCDNLLTNVIRAWNTQYPVVIAPAMVSHAYNHPATRWHLKTIKDEMKWIEVLRPTEKVVGSFGEIGLGGMMPWNEIVDKIVNKLGGYPEDDAEDDDAEDEDRGGNLDDQDEDDDGNCDDEPGGEKTDRHGSRGSNPAGC